MTALDVFLYGMPLVLMAGAGVTLWFAKRAAKQIRDHDEPTTVETVQRFPRIARPEAPEARRPMAGVR